MNVCRLKVLNAIKEKEAKKCGVNECFSCGWYMPMEEVDQIKDERDARWLEHKKARFSKKRGESWYLEQRYLLLHSSLVG